MNNHFKYALSKYTYWFTGFATIICVIAIVPVCTPIAISIVIACFILPLIIPLIVSYIKNEFRIKTIGHSRVTVAFGDLFDEECFVITTNRNFDINPDGKYVAENSVLGLFVQRFFPNDIDELEKLISSQLSLNENGDIIPEKYGKTINVSIHNKLVYFMAFTDREKSKQPNDFYLKSMRAFLKELSKANHGKIISIPLIGNNNNLSDTGFHSSEMTFESLITMINEFEIENPKSELKLKIVVLPENRADIIKSIALHTRRI